MLKFIDFIRKLIVDIFNLRNLRQELASLKQENASLKAENDNLKIDLKTGQEEHEILKQKFDVFQRMPPTEFDKKSGTLIGTKDNFRYCISCKVKTIISPLQELEHGWQCNIKECKEFYNNPEYKPPAVSTQRRIYRSRINWDTY